MTGNDSECKSLIMMTLSSRSENSLGRSRVRYMNTPLNERCTVEDIAKLREAFAEAYMGKVFPDELRSLMHELLNLDYDDDEFNILFLKINRNRDGAVTWDEVLSFLILGYFTNDPENQRATLEPPIVGLPRVIRSMHRHPVSRITFCPDVAKDRSTNNMLGMYLTASRDGMVNWWTLDMGKLRTAFSSSPYLKVRTTWVTDMVCMPDVNIVVTSSTERDLRFYDCTAKTFTLKIIISSWESMICTMHYHFNKDETMNNLLILGDVGGSVRVLEFSPIQRGPFQSKASKALTQLRHVDMQKRPRMLPEMKLTEFHHVHNEWVRQVSYYASLHCIVSCATCPDSLLMTDLAGSKTHNMFKVEKGIFCFTFDEDSHVLVTGGPDCTIRVWNPFVTAKPNAVFQGHHAGIIALVLQNNGQLLYSLARDRVVKVWDIAGQLCMQTYIDIPSNLGERNPITGVYNPATRELILASIKIAILLLNEQLSPLHTDGFTHSRAISKVLYNPLFKVIVTCGLDSIIITWDPETGKRNVMIREAHTRLLHGEYIPVEITSACFDPGFQLLVTGARNGTLKIWNFNTGLCLRDMHVEHMMEVTNVFWIEGRIFSIGWNRHITEFIDSGMAETGKAWETRHEDDVLAAAVRSPLSLATTSYKSELILWKLETGQPYRRFSCTDPMLRIKMFYGKKPPEPKRGAQMPAARKVSVVRVPNCIPRDANAVIDYAAAVRKAQARHSTQLAPPQPQRHFRPLAIYAAIFLEMRPFSSRVASLMLTLENGMVQGWSDHPAGGLQGSFFGVHSDLDYVASLATDLENQFLFTGTTKGYVKVWLMANYLLDEPVHVCMPELRLQFPFMWRDRIDGRAKRTVRNQPLPVLLNSYRGHLRSITTIAYIDDRKILLTGSSDYSVRMWKLGGEYMQTLGGLTEYSLETTSFPMDVKKIASSTTMKVWKGGFVSRYTPGQVEVDPLRDITEYELENLTFPKKAEEPLLGRYFDLPPRPDRQDPIKLDDSLQTIPLYRHLHLASTVPVKRPPTPDLVRRTRLKKTVKPPLPHVSISSSKETVQRTTK